MPGLYKPHTKYQHKTQVGHHIYVQNHRYIFIPIQAAEVLTTLNWRHIQSGYIHRLALYQPPYRATILNLMSIPNIPKRAYHHQHEYVNTHAQTPTRMHRQQHARADTNTHAQTPTSAHRHQLAHTQTRTRRHKYTHTDKFHHYVLLKHIIQWRTYLRMQLKENKQITLSSLPCNTIMHNDFNIWHTCGCSRYL